MYESDCLRCNEVDAWRTRDIETIEDTREVASIYVGETCRSLNERSGEHWGEAMAGKETNHIVQHFSEAHGGEGDMSVRFRLVK